LQTILETWGRKCDALIAVSSQDDLDRHAVNITSSPEGYWGIYDKLLKSLRLVLNAPAVPTFDWILKADDDTYLIWENLQSFLQNQTYRPHIPVVYGRTMPWPRLGELGEFVGWFETPKEKQFRDRVWKRFSKQRPLVYAHGGPGYIMNLAYARALVDAYFHSDDAVKGPISEDMANSFNMMYRNITPTSTLERTGALALERSHPESPQTMYENPDWLPMAQSKIENTRSGPGCCSPTSISFHHMTPTKMKLVEYQLYQCRRG